MQTSDGKMTEKIRLTERVEKSDSQYSKKLPTYVVAFSIKETYDDIRTDSGINSERKPQDINLTPKSSEDTITQASDKSILLGSGPETSKNEIKINIDFDDLEEAIEENNNNSDVEDGIYLMTANSSNEENKNISEVFNFIDTEKSKKRSYEELQNNVSEDALKKAKLDKNGHKDPEVLFDFKQNKRHKPIKRRARNHFTALKIKNTNLKNKFAKKIQKYYLNNTNTSAELQKNLYDTCINVVSRYQKKTVKNALAKENLLESDFIEFYNDEDPTLTSSASTGPTIKNCSSHNILIDSSLNSSSTGESWSNNSVIEIRQRSKSPPYKSDVINVNSVTLGAPFRQKPFHSFLENISGIPSKVLTSDPHQTNTSESLAGLTSSPDSVVRNRKENVNFQNKFSDVTLTENITSDETLALTSTEQPIVSSELELSSYADSLTEVSCSDATLTSAMKQNTIFSVPTFTTTPNVLGVPGEKLILNKSSSSSSKKNTNESSSAYCISSCTELMEETTAVNSVENTKIYNERIVTENSDLLTLLKSISEKSPLKITISCQTPGERVITASDMMTMTSGDNTYEKKVFKPSDLQQSVRKICHADSGQVQIQKINLPDETALRALINEKSGTFPLKDSINPEPTEIWDKVVVVLDVITQRLERNLTAKIKEEIRSFIDYCNQKNSRQSIDLKKKYCDKSEQEDKAIQCNLLENETLDDLKLRQSMEPKLISSPNIVKEPILYQEIDVLKPAHAKTVPLEEVITEESLTATAMSADPRSQTQNKFLYLASKLVVTVYLFVRDNLFVIMSIPTFFVLIFMLYVGIAILYEIL